MMDLSIVLVNFNTCQLTLDALNSIYRSKTHYQYEIILTDNASDDNSVIQIRNHYPDVHIIKNDQNVGFSKANNQAIGLSVGRYVLLLNTDTVLSPETLDVMVRFMDEHSSVGASGCKILLPDGSLDKACRRGFPTPLASLYYAFGISYLFPSKPHFNRYQLGYLDENKDYSVDSLVGAFMLVRREAINQVGLLDEDFFMYGEDIDWCYRIKEAGWQIYYYPYTQIIHYKGGSSRQKPFKIIYEFHRSMILFHRKHFLNKYSWLIHMLVYAGIFIKFILSLIKNKLRVKR